MSENVLPGWICCECRSYNSPARGGCWSCGHRICLSASKSLNGMKAAVKGTKVARAWGGVSKRVVEAVPVEMELEALVKEQAADAEGCEGT